MISRVWYDWTTPQNAEAYEALLKSQIFSGILAKKIAGFVRIELFRRQAGYEVEFVTVMWFATMEAVKAFAGGNFEEAVIRWPRVPYSSASTAIPVTTKWWMPVRSMRYVRPARSARAG